MSQNSATIATIVEPISGEGPNLYIVSSTQLEDAETSVEMWRGNSEDHVLDQVYEHMMKMDEVEEAEISEAFYFLVKLVGHLL
jgi:hypothetical protein